MLLFSFSSSGSNICFTLSQKILNIHLPEREDFWVCLPTERNKVIYLQTLKGPL